MCCVLNLAGSKPGVAFADPKVFPLKLEGVLNPSGLPNLDLIIGAVCFAIPIIIQYVCQKGLERRKMSAKLFIGNLDYTVTSDDLRDAFSKFGTVVDAVVITDRETKRSRGFGFVEFSSEEEAKKAVEGMNQQELKGRKINVNEAKPQENR